MGKRYSQRVIKQKYVPRPFELPVMGRKRPRAYEEWRALKEWDRLSRQEQRVAGFILRQAREEQSLQVGGHRRAKARGGRDRVVVQVLRADLDVFVNDQLLRLGYRAHVHESSSQISPSFRITLT